MTFVKNLKTGLQTLWSKINTRVFLYFGYGNLFRSRLLCFEAVVFWLLALKLGFEAKYLTSKLASTFGLCFSLQKYQYWRKLFVFALLILNNLRNIFSDTKALKTLLFRALKPLALLTHKPLFLPIFGFSLLPFSVSLSRKAYCQWLLL